MTWDTAAAGLFLMGASIGIAVIGIREWVRTNRAANALHAAQMRADDHVVGRQHPRRAHRRNRLGAAPEHRAHPRRACRRATGRRPRRRRRREQVAVVNANALKREQRRNADAFRGAVLIVGYLAAYGFGALTLVGWLR